MIQYKLAAILTALCTLSATLTAHAETLSLPCNTILAYQVGELLLSIPRNLSFTQLFVYRVEEEGEFLYYEYDIGYTEAIDLSLALIEGNYKLVFLIPSDTESNVWDSYVYSFTVADPDMDTSGLYTSSLLCLTIYAEKDIASIELPDLYCYYENSVLVVPDYLLFLREDFQLGDVNHDGEYNANDSSMILSQAAGAGAGGGTILTRMEECMGDVNLDGVTNAADASVLLSYAAYAGAGGTLSFEEYLGI